MIKLKIQHRDVVDGFLYLHDLQITWLDFFPYILFYFKSEHHNMVWEVKTNQMPNAVQKLLLVMDKRASGMNDSLELLQCNENLPSSPGYNSCDEHMELGKQN